MALAEGTSRVLAGPLTLHTKTAIHIAKKLTQVNTILISKLNSFCGFDFKHNCPTEVKSICKCHSFLVAFD